MIDLSTLELQRSWPLGLLGAAALLLAAAWWFGRSASLPSLAAIAESPRQHRFRHRDRLPAVSGCVLLVLLTVVLADPSFVVRKTLSRDARDFVLLVDTSRSMRHDTDVRRADLALHFERRANAFMESVADPNRLPFVARYELARESLYRFLNARRPDDRVAILYFNDDVLPVTGLSGNVAFAADQLAGMDEFVNWGTDIEAAIDTSLDMLERYPGDNRRSIILLTDAEARFSDDLASLFDRLQDSNLVMHTLWITADIDGLFSDDAAAFLELARSVGSVSTIRSPDAINLQQAFEEISRSESYSYQQVTAETIRVSTWLTWPVIAGFLVWQVFAATAWFPAGRRDPLETRA